MDYLKLKTIINKKNGQISTYINRKDIPLELKKKILQKRYFKVALKNVRFD